MAASAANRRLKRRRGTILEGHEWKAVNRPMRVRASLKGKTGRLQLGQLGRALTAAIDRRGRVGWRVLTQRDA